MNQAQVQENQPEDAVQTQEQNRVMNQGEESQIKTQEKNEVKSGTGADRSEQRKSDVAKAVKEMLQVADREGGIGQQVKVIAQNQNQSQNALEENIKKIENRGAVSKFFFGPNYGEIKDAEKLLAQNREQIRELNRIRTEISDEGVQNQLAEQIRVLERTSQEVETLLEDAQEGFSLFGWLNKLIS
jgi:hypothetical protein